MMWLSYVELIVPHCVVLRWCGYQSECRGHCAAAGGQKMGCEMSQNFPNSWMKCTEFDTPFISVRLRIATDPLCIEIRTNGVAEQWWSPLQHEWSSWIRGSGAPYEVSTPHPISPYFHVLYCPCHIDPPHLLLL